MNSARRILLLEDAPWGGVHTLCKTLADALANDDWQVVAVNWRDTSWRELLALARSANVLVASHNFGATYAAIVLKWLTHKPVISWVHGPLMEVLHQARASWLKRLQLHWFYGQVTRFVCVSRTTQNSLLEFLGHPAQHRTTVILNAVAPMPEGQALHVHIPHSADNTLPPLLLGFVGRFSPEKRPGFLLETLRELPEHAQLGLIGEGPLRHTLVHQGMDLLQQGRLHFLGKHPSGASLYKPWQMTLLASRYEGFGMAALESLACGVPCVALPIPAMRELYALDAPYLLARGDTPIALAEAVMAVFSLPNQKVQQDMARIVARHNLEDFTRAWQEVLRTC
jgi:glycosyltransferase involved in cell wall biosynthesis